MSTDSEIESAFNSFKDVIIKKISHKDSIINSLKSDLQKHQSDISALQFRISELSTKNAELVSKSNDLVSKNEILEARNSQLETLLAKSDKKIAEMSRAVAKLNSFKQSVMSAAGVGVDGFGGDLGFESKSQHTGSLANYRGPVGSVDLDTGASTIQGSSPQLLHHDTYIPDTTMRYSKPKSDNKLDDIKNHSRDTSYQSQHSQLNLNHNGSALYTQTQFPQQQHILLDNSNLNASPTRKTTVTFAEESKRHNSSNAMRNTAQYVNSYLDDKNSMSVPTNRTSNAESVDGRDFFKRARSIMSYDEFTNLLWNVRAYNNREQSKQRTLEILNEAMSVKYPELLAQFETLISK